MPRFPIRITLPLLLLLQPLAVTAAVAGTDPTFTLQGDLRAGYFYRHRAERTGGSHRDDDWRLRLRLGLHVDPGTGWQGAVRLAGRYSTDQERGRVHLPLATTTASGMDLGEATLDTLYLAHHSGRLGTLQMGRFQTGAVLPGPASKSLSRNDSSNTEINWTDGLRWHGTPFGDWRTQAIVEYNSDGGGSNNKRAPLDFQRDGARWSAFAGVENTRSWGPVVHRALDVTWLPRALPHRGDPAGGATDYLAFTARLAARWPLGSSGTALMLGGEVGYAPDTPRTVAVVPGRAGRADGHAWQVALSLLEFMPGHNLALIAGEAGAGWLVSPDYAPNLDLREIRYQWHLDRRHRIEARLRQREELRRRPGAQRPRSDTDLYLRYTFSF